MHIEPYQKKIEEEKKAAEEAKRLAEEKGCTGGCCSG